jgi:VanZ family protein
VEFKKGEFFMEKVETNFWGRWLLFGGYLILLVALSLAPSSKIGTGGIRIPHLDKLVHAVMYGVMAAVFLWCRRTSRFAGRPGWGVILIAVLFGGLMELLQYWFVVVHRSFSLGDIVANGVGASIVVAWSAFAHRRVGQALEGE